MHLPSQKLDDISCNCKNCKQQRSPPQINGNYNKLHFISNSTKLMHFHVNCNLSNGQKLEFNFTVWKFQDFSATEISREINFRRS